MRINFELFKAWFGRQTRQDQNGFVVGAITFLVITVSISILVKTLLGFFLGLVFGIVIGVLFGVIGSMLSVGER